MFTHLSLSFSTKVIEDTQLCESANKRYDKFSFPVILLLGHCQFCKTVMYLVSLTKKF